jgi:hypothetical protein
MIEPNAQSTSSEYPVQFSVEYPDRDLNRLTTAFRLIVAIPILILVAALGGGAWGGYGDEASRGAAVGAGGVLFLPPLLMIVFRQKYPRWWYDWNLEPTISAKTVRRAQPERRRRGRAAGACARDGTACSPRSSCGNGRRRRARSPISRCVSRARPRPLVPRLIYPSRTRVPLSVCKTHPWHSFPAKRSVRGTRCVSRDVARVVSDVSVLCPRCVIWGGNK